MQKTTFLTINEPPLLWAVLETKEGNVKQLRTWWFAVVYISEYIGFLTETHDGMHWYDQEILVIINNARLTDNAKHVNKWIINIQLRWRSGRSVGGDPTAAAGRAGGQGWVGREEVGRRGGGVVHCLESVWCERRVWMKRGVRNER